MLLSGGLIFSVTLAGHQGLKLAEGRVSESLGLRRRRSKGLASVVASSSPFSATPLRPY